MKIFRVWSATKQENEDSRNESQIITKVSKLSYTVFVILFGSMLVLILATVSTFIRETSAMRIEGVSSKTRIAHIRFNILSCQRIFDHPNKSVYHVYTII